MKAEAEKAKAEEAEEAAAAVAEVQVEAAETEVEVEAAQAAEEVRSPGRVRSLPLHAEAPSPEAPSPEVPPPRLGNDEPVPRGRSLPLHAQEEVELTHAQEQAQRLRQISRANEQHATEGTR